MIKIQWSVYVCPSERYLVSFSRISRTYECVSATLLLTMQIVPSCLGSNRNKQAVGKQNTEKLQNSVRLTLLASGEGYTLLIIYSFLLDFTWTRQIYCEFSDWLQRQRNVSQWFFQRVFLCDIFEEWWVLINDRNYSDVGLAGENYL